MDPRSGDILAMASRPNYLQVDLHRYLSGEEESGISWRPSPSLTVPS